MPPPDPPASTPWHIAIDFDGVLFDQAQHVRTRFQTIHGIQLGPPNEWPWDLTQHPLVEQAGLTQEDTWQIFHAIHNDPTLHDADPLDPHAIPVLEQLTEAGHRVDIVTARSKESRAPTRTFLDRNQIPHRDLVMGARTKTGYDILIDDLPQHVQKAADHGALALLMDQPYNQAYPADTNPYRVDGFQHVAQLLDAAPASKTP